MDSTTNNHQGNEKASSSLKNHAAAAMTDGSDSSSVHEDHPDFDHGSNDGEDEEDNAKRPREDTHDNNETGGKQKKRKKAKKPDGYPTRPLSAYNFFFKDERVKWLEEKRDDKDFEGLNPFLGMSAAIGTRWKALSDDQKQPYEDAADKDRERYKKEMEEYSEKLIREAALERMASSERHIRTHSTTSQPSVDHASQQQQLPNHEAPRETNAPALSSSSTGSQLMAQLQQILQASTTSGGSHANELVQLLPFLLSLHTPIPQNLSVTELLNELQRVQQLTDMLLRNRLRVTTTQNQASETQTLLSILQHLGQQQ